MDLPTRSGVAPAKRRILRSLVVAGITVGLVAAAGEFAIWQARVALDNRSQAEAARWLAVAGWLSPRRGEAAFLEARLARRDGRYQDARGRLLAAADVPATTTWSQLSKTQATQLLDQLTASTFAVTGKSTNKDEFVTCGGVSLDEIDFRTMQSKLVPGLYFAGEVIDVDGITGGFNFQNAWTSGFIAGSDIAAR